MVVHYAEHASSQTRKRDTLPKSTDLHVYIDHKTTRLSSVRHQATKHFIDQTHQDRTDRLVEAPEYVDCEVNLSRWLIWVEERPLECHVPLAWMLTHKMVEEI
jgi:hypothetical protein